jgi:CRISPR-associated protein Cmr4
MYQKAFGIIETLAPLHIGASAGEETGNLNLIFRDQFTQTGIIPGSSLRGRFRAEMRRQEKASDPNTQYPKTNDWYGQDVGDKEEDNNSETTDKTTRENKEKPRDTTEAKVKFEYASLLWLPVFCPGQPVVWLTCPRLLRRYQRIAGIEGELPKPYTASPDLQGRKIEGSNEKILFFNLGFMKIPNEDDQLVKWLPEGVEFATDITADKLVVVDDNDLGILHDMALYRQSRASLQKDMKKVTNFFNVEALPEGSILVFPVALKEHGWQPFGSGGKLKEELYFGGLESIGFGHCRVNLGKEYFTNGGN